MSNKKRRLSPSLSSRSSSTPAPVLALAASSSLNGLGHALLDEVTVTVPIDFRTSASSGSGPAIPKGEQSVVKQATVVPGSGDGLGYGDECFLWADLPMNKQGYRYAPCSPSPTISPSPLHPFYRTLPAPPPTPPVHISWLDRSQFLRLNPTASTASTDRGYRSARANVSVRSGSWYYEAYIELGSGSLGAGGGTGGDVGNAHVRLGWGRREANLDAPVGMDGYSYGIRDVGGEKVHLARSKPYGRSFGTGDVVGCLINLPNRHDDELSTIKRKRVPLRWKGQLYFEMDEYPVQKEMEALVDREGKTAAAAKASAELAKEVVSIEVKGKKGATTKNAKKSKAAREPTGPVSRGLPILERSSIEFYLNGSSLGQAFGDLYDFMPLASSTAPSTSAKRHDQIRELYDDGTLGYYPMISCFGKGKVRVNFGPPWIMPPPNSDVRPIDERWAEWREEEKVLDEKDEAESSERLEREMKEDAGRRIIAEARLAAVRAAGGSDGGTPKRKGKGGVVKKRKGTVEVTPTPSSAPTPGAENHSTPAAEDTESLATDDGIIEEVVVKLESESDIRETPMDKSGMDVTKVPSDTRAVSESVQAEL